MRTQEDSGLLTSNTILADLGDISVMTLYRWMADPAVQFPRPIKIRGRNYWRVADVRAWKQAQVPHREAAAA